MAVFLWVFLIGSVALVEIDTRKVQLKLSSRCKSIGLIFLVTANRIGVVRWLFSVSVVFMVLFSIAFVSLIRQISLLLVLCCILFYSRIWLIEAREYLKGSNGSILVFSNLFHL